MQSPKEITGEIERLKSLNLLVETYETIAASTMRRIRHFVLQNREYHLGLNRVFQQVRLAYDKEVKKLLDSKKRALKNIFLLRQKRTAYVFLSANEGLYGDLIDKTFAFFMNEWSVEMPDAVIVGHIGKTLFETAAPGKKFTYFDFSDRQVALKDLRKIMEHLSQYERVLVFHGAFRNFFEQNPVASSVSGDELGMEESSKEETVKYLFEPSLEEVATFFQKEIFASLVEQAFQESRLAKVASRLTLLDKATTNIEEATQKTKFLKQQIFHRIVNKKQVDSISGLFLWNS